jgi:hypothetical protein
MKIKKTARALKTALDVKTAPDKGEAVGNIVAGSLAIAHPVVGAVAAPAVRKATAKAVNEGIPAVQRRVSQFIEGRNNER